MIERIGIYPGTFDPVHQGHIAFAEETLLHCHLDRVIFIPETSPRGKLHVTALSARLELLRRTLRESATLETLHIISSPFTVTHTLPELQQLFPQAELTLLIGSDIIPTFDHRWEGLDELFKTMPLAIGLRAGDTKEMIQDILSRHEHERATSIRHTLIQTPHAHVSSSAIRPHHSSRKI